MKEISIKELDLNPYQAFADEWLLLTAGNEERGYNTMTVGWGHLGAIFAPDGKYLPTAIAYVRPQRYTKEFMEREDYFTLSLLPEGHKKELGYLGSKSGRDEDKIANVGFHPAFIDETTYIKEARLVLVCKKIYTDQLKEDGFLNQKIIDVNYPDKDFHHVYIGEIVKVLVEE